MIGRLVLENALEALFNEGLEEAVEYRDCPECGKSFAKIGCSKPHCRQDLMMINENDGEGWKVMGIVYPEFPIENSCECGPPSRILNLVPDRGRDERDS
jgi:hypothetical protein